MAYRQQMTIALLAASIFLNIALAQTPAVSETPSAPSAIELPGNELFQLPGNVVPAPLGTQPGTTTIVTPSDRSLSEGVNEKNQFGSPGTPDGDLPIHPNPQITRLLVKAALLEKESAKKYGKNSNGERLKLYEQIVIRACAPNFAFDFAIPNPLPNDFACLDTLNKTTLIHAQNPTAACIEHGLLSPECATFSAQQRSMGDSYLERTSPLYRLLNGDSQDLALKNFKELQVKVDAFFSSKPTEFTREQADLVKRFLAVTCSDYRLTTETYRSEAAKENDPTRKMLMDAIQTLEKNAPTPVGPAPERLVRILPDICQNAITRINTQHLRLAAAVCYTQGPLSPFCIDAIKQERQRGFRSAPSIASKTPGAKNPEEPPQDGLQSF